MGMMKRLLDDNQGGWWTVIPQVVQVSERHHIANGSYRLMEMVGDGHFVIERQVGGKRELDIIADRNNKEDYHTPLTKADVIEKERFSVMERVRITHKGERHGQ